MLAEFRSFGLDSVVALKRGFQFAKWFSFKDASEARKRVGLMAYIVADDANTAILFASAYH